MDFCCPNDRQLQGIYINELQSTRQRPQKAKYSFRTTQDNSYTSSARSLHQMPVFSNITAEDVELQELQRQYRRLKDQQEAISQFQQRRIGSLLNDIIKYQIEIEKRDREIDELQTLFKLKLQEKRHFQQQQQQQQQVQVSPGNFPPHIPQQQQQSQRTLIPIQFSSKPTISYSQVSPI